MASGGGGAGVGYAWFLGASFGGVDDRSERFVREGVWEHGYTDRYIEEVKSIQPGDRVALKSAYTRKHGLPLSQDIDGFRNRPFWVARYGDRPQDADRFAWFTFYTAFADHLLAYRDDREPLISAIHELSKLEVPLSVQDKFADGSSGPLRDICPFTIFGLFNRRITNDNRRRIARAASSIGITAPLPESFEGIPVLDNRRSWFFPFANERSTDHIDVLWRVFSDALEYADSGDSTSRQRFTDSFDAAIARRGVGRQDPRGSSLPQVDGWCQARKPSNITALFVSAERDYR